MSTKHLELTGARTAWRWPPLVLGYHGLGRFERSLDPANLMVDPARFQTQLRTLLARGYRFIALSDFARRLEAGAGLDRCCALTFDDGTVDNLSVLAPLLAAFAAPATIFACPGLLGQPHFAMPASAGVRLMDADELRQLAAMPLIEVGSHTNQHVDLSAATSDAAYKEMVSSRLALEELLQQAVDAFAYPKCGYSPDCPDAARAAGYKVAVTCAGKGSRHLFELARESIDSLDRRLGFALKSRRLFWPVRNSAPGKLLRAAVRPVRHGSQ